MDISNDRGDKKTNVLKPDLYLPLQDIEKLPGNQTPNLNYPSQNIHRSLALYEHDLTSGHMSQDDLANLLHIENKFNLVALLQETGVIANSQQCKFCGGHARQETR